MVVDDNRVTEKQTGLKRSGADGVRVRTARVARAGFVRGASPNATPPAHE